MIDSIDDPLILLIHPIEWVAYRADMFYKSRFNQVCWAGVIWNRPAVGFALCVIVNLSERCIFEIFKTFLRQTSLSVPSDRQCFLLYGMVAAAKAIRN